MTEAVPAVVPSRARSHQPGGRRAVVQAIVVGLVAGLVNLLLQVTSQSDYPGDFVWALRTAYTLANGIDPYGFTPDPQFVPYPLPIALFGLPFLWVVGVLPLYFPGGVFIGVSAGLLTWSMLRAGENWRLATILLSGPFWIAVQSSQWSPLIVAAWYIPVLAPLLVLIKPQTALPVATARAPSRLGLLIAAVVLLVSLMVYPSWPFRFLSLIGPYQSTIPMLTLPFGPLLIVAAFRWRDERARLLLLMSIMPLRTVYDFLPLWLVPTRLPAALVLTGLSGLVVLAGLPTWPAIMVTPDMRWAIHILFLPLLALVLWKRN